MYVYQKDYDVIVVGGGHAGIEAALSSARIGCQTLLLTSNLDTIGQMSCNPAIGGLAKGHLVREIDALGGEMGKATDMAGLQFRMLNTKKGPAVWAPRAQCDKKFYQLNLKYVCERQHGLDCQQGLTSRLLVHSDHVIGVETMHGVQYRAECVILTTGTFLRALMHFGPSKQPGGRAGESSADNLTSSLVEIGLMIGRLKTGTPPRLNRRSIDFSKTVAQLGEEPPPYFSYWKEDLFHVEHSTDQPRAVGLDSSTYPPGPVLSRLGGQLPCYISSTTEETGRIIRENLHHSPLYSGDIEGVGPRYCPSIEDKIVKFPEKERHQVFLEPEGSHTEEIYVNGLSTSLPFSVQVALIRSVVGCENAEIVRPAYAVEYDFVYPTQIRSTLESKCCEGLFLAGQINGTSGYEEAAAQGIMAGINAARKVLKRPQICLRRDQAYIGVLIDDLVTKGTTEPYRMFTSRAEYRLLLRQDNADRRLSQVGFEIGLLKKHNHELFSAKKLAIDREVARLMSCRVDGITMAQLLRRPEIKYADLPSRNDYLAKEVIIEVETQIKYAGYIERQEQEISRLRSDEEKLIPDWIDYANVQSLRTEARIKLNAIRPRTIGQASRISGVSPSDIAVLSIHLKRGPQAGANAQV